MEKSYSRALYWFTHDLRLNDNPALMQAQLQSRSLCYCYIIDKRSITRGRYGLPALGKHRLSFILQSLNDLESQLKAAGHSLTVRIGEPLDEISQLISTHQFDAVFGGLQAGVYERRRWQQLDKQFRFVNFHQYENSSLLRQNQLPFDWQDFPASYSKFRKRLEPLSEHFPAQPAHQADFSHAPVRTKLRPSVQQLPPTDNTWIAGGERAAQQHLTDYFSGNAPSNYKQTRNALHGFDQSTKLSAYLANGNLSPQQAVNAVRDYENRHGANDSTYWIVFELLWREYFFWYLYNYQHKVFAVKGVAARKFQTTFYPTRFKHWCEGTTPYPLVNACMKQLNETGYMSNRGRQIVASCLVNELAVDWRYGAAYFEQQLLDYDIGSNWGNWQYIAGVGADPRGGRHFNIAKQTQQFDPDGLFIAYWQGNTTCSIDSTDAADWPIKN